MLGRLPKSLRMRFFSVNEYAIARTSVKAYGLTHIKLCTPC
jgi:hypothetical protein